MAIGGDQDAFASLIQAQPVCNQVNSTANCNPVWYSTNKGFARDNFRFISFYGEDDTDTCLALECPPCSTLNTKGHDWVWSSVLISLTFPPLSNTSSTWRFDRAAHIGTTAIWPWARTPNAKNGANSAMPYTVSDTPFIVQNGSHLVAEVAYTENGQSNSNTFRDLIGLPNELWSLGHYSAKLIIPSRQDWQTLPSDSSIILQAPPWPGWDASQAYTATTIPTLIGSLGGLWTAFTGAIAGIFGTSVAFILFGSKPLSISPTFPFGKRVTSHNLDAMYLSPDVPVDREARLRALMAYMADFVVDTGELDLKVGRVPGGSGGLLGQNTKTRWWRMKEKHPEKEDESENENAFETESFRPEGELASEHGTVNGSREQARSRDGVLSEV